ncbi:MAG: ATP-dependent Clp protease adaptor ClpS [Muribaculaceae bacterium]|nr:ATP-dependent Clp protease adaptor ClpS [Muribaculaceae bacterium]MDE6682567.1 ATP-dependent Clp protease adaptor ClpS [Muribaculaceae bacterium]
MPQEQFSVKERNSVRTCEPRKYKVMFHNDDFTTMEFVMQVLKEIFYKSDVEAYNITMDVHKRGKGIAGIYVYDLAVTKRDRAVEMAREEGFPLKITVEPV